MTRFVAPLLCVLAAGSLAFAQGAASAPASQPTAAAPAAGGDSDLMPKVKLETSLGDIVLELNGEKAPISTLNFLEYAEAGHYNGLIFHRIIPTFMIQAGGYTPDMAEKRDGLRPGIKNEWKNGLKNTRGTIAMARLGNQPDSATAQFFINVVDNAMLDMPRDGAGYAVFGKVVEGMDIVDKIKDVETVDNPKLPMGKVVPKEPIIIKKAAAVGKANLEKIKEHIKAAEAEAVAAVVKQREGWEKSIADTIKKVETDTGKKVQRTPKGSLYVVLAEGNGASPKPTDTVKVNYAGTLTNGEKFDASADHGGPAEFPLNRVIPGWTEGVGLMKVGAKYKFILPPDLAYGERGSPPKIGPNATLIFDIELLDITAR